MGLPQKRRVDEGKLEEEGRTCAEVSGKNLLRVLGGVARGHDAHELGDGSRDLETLIKSGEK